MNDSGPRIPDGETPARKSPRLPEKGPGDGKRPRVFPDDVFPDDTQRDVVYGVCRVTLQLGEPVRFPYGQGTTCSTPVVW